MGGVIDHPAVNFSARPENSRGRAEAALPPGRWIVCGYF
jgi:hypothetical protein